MRPRGPYLALLPMGLAVPPLLPTARCALTAPFHPYLCRHRRSVFCGAFPWVSPAGRYPASSFCGVRTFLAALHHAAIQPSAHRSFRWSAAVGQRGSGWQGQWLGPYPPHPAVPWPMDGTGDETPSTGFPHHILPSFQGLATYLLD